MKELKKKQFSFNIYDDLKYSKESFTSTSHPLEL